MSIQNKLCTYADCKLIMLPLFDALEIVRGKWRLPILLAIMFGNKRFKQISKEVVGISDKILSKELKILEENLLIKRTVYDTFPPTVEYQTTKHSESLEKVMIELKNWGELHRKKIIDTIGEKFDKQESDRT